MITKEKNGQRVWLITRCDRDRSSYPVPARCLFTCVAWTSSLSGFARFEPSQPLNERANNRLTRPSRNPLTNTGRSNSMYRFRTCKEPKQWNQCDWLFAARCLLFYYTRIYIHCDVKKKNKNRNHCVLWSFWMFL